MNAGAGWQQAAYPPLERIEAILAAIGKVRAALIGDLCLDAYWKADLTRSELSRETPHFPLPVIEEHYAPGAGGNVAANLAALAPAGVEVIGVAGDDWRWQVLRQELVSGGIAVSGVILSPGRLTNAYIKPYRRGLSAVEYEDPRLDFANYSPQPAELDEALIAALESRVSSADVLCVSDQFLYGCITDRVRTRIGSLARQGLTVVADSRSRIGLFRNCILKPNELEGLTALGWSPRDAQAPLDDLASAAAALAVQAAAPVCLTLGSRGCLTADAGPVRHIPAVDVAGPLDICGAGDTFLAMFACSLAAGASIAEAAAMGSLASGVTIRKIGQTGTANRKEILAIASSMGGSLR